VRSKLMNRLLLPCSLLAGLLAVHPAGAEAQASRVIRIVVPSTAGGGADVLIRVLADQIGRVHDRTIVVENRPGAGNTIGTDAVARAAPDGHTLLITTPEFVINPHLRKLSYDPLTSFAPVCYLARSPQLFVVNANSPYRSFPELLDAARAKPGALTIGSAGPASSPHVAVERIKQQAGLDLTYVPYQGSGPAINDLLGQHITAALASYPNVAEQVKSGQLRAIATAGASRVDDFPDVPTVAESGFDGFEFDIWFDLAAPSGTPKRVVSSLSEWFKAALNDPATTTKLRSQGVFGVGQCGSEYAAFTRKQFEDYGRIIRAANINQN
jgi:tripartite-type tricarboxylate transporter receptor subunit TctC